MPHWLMKSEPDELSILDLQRLGKTRWDGVRNYQARNFMRAMKLGDRGLFYHSNIGKEAVGIVEVIAEAHPDSKADDPKWECVDIKAVKPLPKAISLDQAKQEPALKDMVLVNNSRLSVQPVTDAEWDAIMRLSGV